MAGVRSRRMLERFCKAFEPGARIGRVRRLRGGISSTMQVVELIAPSGVVRRVVVRSYGTERLELAAELAAREWHVLELLRDTGTGKCTR